jgi:hypothetical protein
MQVSNLFNYCDNSDITRNKAIYYIGNIYSNSLFVLSIDNTTNKIYSYSNEWLYLIKTNYYPKDIMYAFIVSNYNNIIRSKPINTDYINENVIPFITSFSRGTVHGYTGLFCILTEYIHNLDLYKNFKILVYKNSQKGLLDIINHFINKQIIKSDNIIYISSDIQYLFNSIKFIPNKIHNFDDFENNISVINNITDIIDKYIISDKYDIDYYTSLSIPKHDNICIIKSSTSDNRTSSGVVDINKINEFCMNNNLLFIEPTNMNEISLIHTINQCKILVLSWGTAFFKNYIYISDACEKIIVLVIEKDFINQYKTAGNKLVTKFKNATIVYRIIGRNLNLQISNI